MSKFIAAAIVTSALALSACGSTPGERALSGGAIGAAAGAAAGAVVGSPAAGAAIGGAAGAATGALTDRADIDLGDSPF
ncbi:MAG: YMGG-like glycine zipper-containing protein [Pseudomonadota bacterium]